MEQCGKPNEHLLNEYHFCDGKKTHAFEESEVIENVTVQVLKCKVCGETSIGWWRTKEQEETARWVERQGIGPDWYTAERFVLCSKCNGKLYLKGNSKPRLRFCPHCGVKMEGKQ